ncbi:MAG: glycerol dehydrogenase [Bacteroidales bacterium]|nr:glycerol dehydrogenase [Bacteroidales bacterium]
MKPFKAVFPGKYIQAEGAVARLPELIKLLGNKGLILASPTVIKNILPQYTTFSEWKESLIISEFSGECSEKEVERVCAVIRSEKLDVIIGMGGGKTIDTAKIAADKTGIPVIVAPTIASTDAPCSGCAVVYSQNGVFDYVYYQKLNPQVVLVDTKIISAAPSRFLVSGMGDALATWFEARSCERTNSENACGGYSTLTGLSIAKLCYETLLKYGMSAKTANDNHIITPAFNHVVEANILLSGIGFESSGLGAAHAIHNGLTALEQTHGLYHGEKVAFGLLASLHLTDNDPFETETVYQFCENIGLPTTFREINMNDVCYDDLMKVAIATCRPEESIHHEACDIQPERVVAAMIAADATGLLRKKQY